jgi:hypothetical protein
MPPGDVNLPDRRHQGLHCKMWTVTRGHIRCLASFQPTAHEIAIPRPTALLVMIMMSINMLCAKEVITSNVCSYSSIRPLGSACLMKGRELDSQVGSR